MSGKLRFRWTGPYWITRELSGSYQLGTLAGEVLRKWVNGFRLKPYLGSMPRNSFEKTKADTELDTGKQAKAAPRLAIGKHERSKHGPANGKLDAMTSSPTSGNSETSKGAQHPDRVPVGPDAE